MMLNVLMGRKSNNSGVTLIELLVVVTILGIVGSLVTFAYPNAQKRARDTTRKSDLSQYRTALETYANRSEGSYPQRNVAAGVRVSTILCADLGLSSCPEDPSRSLDSTYEYRYQTNGTGSTGNPTATQYVLWTKIDISSDYWVVCSNGKSGTDAQAGFSVSGGNCPI